MSRARPTPESPTDDRTRLDKWLWAARFFKTRAIAAEAIEGGKVHVNEERAKRARPLREGDEVRVRSGPFEHRVIVRALSTRRGAAVEAARLYEELPESRAARERVAAYLRAQGAKDAGRPTKKDRRELRRLKDQRRKS